MQNEAAKIAGLVGVSEIRAEPSRTLSLTLREKREI